MRLRLTNELKIINERMEEQANTLETPKRRPETETKVIEDAH